MGSSLRPLGTERSGAGGAKQERAPDTVVRSVVRHFLPRLAEQHGWPVAAADLSGASEPGQ